MGKGGKLNAQLGGQGIQRVESTWRKESKRQSKKKGSLEKYRVGGSGVRYRPGSWKIYGDVWGPDDTGKTARKRGERGARITF